MKKRRFPSVAALMMSLVLGACSAGQAEPATGRQSIPDDADVALVDSVSRVDYSASFASERPGIMDSVVLDPLDGALEETSLNFFHESTDTPDEIRSVWISYLELDGLLRGKSAEQFRSSIGQVFDNIASYGLNTVVVHVRPFSDALYESDYYPWSYLITGTEGQHNGFDPLQVMIKEAKSRGLRLEAWLNPYRVRSAGSTNALSADNQALAWLNSGDRAAIQYNGVISLNPASEKARTLIINGAAEIARKYDVAAIHIDDYFYPTTDAAFDQPEYSAYTTGGGTLSLADWRRQNVETLMRGMYSAIKAENSSVLFGISPAGNIQGNYSVQYLDVAKIAANPGYCDYICPQLYYGFQNEAQPYDAVLASWNNLATDPSVTLYVGLAAYKIGAQDSYAGAGQTEWVGSTTMMRDQVQSARSQSNYGGFVIYRYDSLFRPASSVSGQVQQEYDNLRSIL